MALKMTKYNSKKSPLLFIASKIDKKLVIRIFQLNEDERARVLRNLRTWDIHKFSMCTVDVKVSLFRRFCSPLYTAHLW